MIKTCIQCGKDFEVIGRGSNAKYCRKCRDTGCCRQRRYYRNHREKILAKQKAQREELKTLKICERCGCEFIRHGRAKYCVDCSEANYREYQARYSEARRVKKPDVKPEVKPVDAQKKQRLAYLRRRLDQAQTPEARRHYFRLYVLLKQEFLRGT